MGLVRQNLARLRVAAGASRLSSDHSALLDQMRADNKAASSSHYQPGPGRGWQKLSREFNDLFHTEGLVNVEEQAYNSRFSSFPPGNKAYYLFAAYQFYRHLKAVDRYGLFERLASTQSKATGAHILEFDGIRVSWDLLLSVHNLMSVAEAVPAIFDEPIVVLDLGAGWGRIGHALLRLNPRATYIAADLPETLLIAEAYLPQTLPSTKSYGYRDHRRSVTRNDFLSESGVHFIGSHMLPQIEDRAIDVFINVASFQEMPDTHVAGYFTDIERLTSQVLYLLQQSAPNTKGGLVGEYPIRSTWKEGFKRACPHLPDYFEALYGVR